MNWHSDNQVHDRYIVAVKKQLDIFLNVFHVLSSVSSKWKALLQHYNLNDILQTYQYYSSAQAGVSDQVYHQPEWIKG